MTPVYPLKFEPIYKEKIWGGRNLERLYGRRLPPGKPIGESWELADLEEGTCTVSNGPLAGQTLTAVTAQLGRALLGNARALESGRFPLLLKLLDANDILSLQVHPDEKAVAEIPGSALKTECWYIVESRDGMLFKGVVPGVTPEEFRRAIETDQAEKVVRAIKVKAGDFHYLPAGTVHAVGAGLVVAEVQTPSDTTYRVTDWGRGREIHVDRSMQCIRPELTGDNPPGAQGETLLVTDYFAVAKRTARPGQTVKLPQGVCSALMILSGDQPMTISHGGAVEPAVTVHAGDTILLPADLAGPALTAPETATWLEITLPEGK